MSKPNNHKFFINFLARHRRLAGLTQAELAKAVLVSRKSINSIENGIYIPSTYLALKIAMVLNCAVEDIFKIHDGTFPLITLSKES